MQTHPNVCGFLQVYHGLWKEKEVVIKCGVSEALKVESSPGAVPRRDVVLFDKPTRGTSMDEFRDMLLNFLKVSAIMTMLAGH